MSVYRIELIDGPLNASTADAFPLDPELREVDFLEDVDWSLPEPLRFSVHRPLAGVTDRPVLDRPVPLFSRRVADALLALGGFEASVYPVQLVDHRGDPVGAEGDFVVFHVRTILDIVDMQSPEVQVVNEGNPLFDGMVIVRRLSVVLPAAGVPPCFRVLHAERFGPIVNEDGKAALDALGPRGFELLEVPSRSSSVA